MRTILALLMLTCVFGCTKKLNPSTDSKGRQLIWSDEFDYTGKPNPSNWTAEIGGHGWGNNELQFYTDRLENAEVSNGTLKIHLIKENYEGKPYTSARLITKNKVTTTYGRIEARIKLPTGKGIWPAFWMMGNDIDQVDWPACGEIDIMEYVGREPDKMWATLHYPERHGGNADGETKMFPGITNDFHVFSVEWSKDSINFFADETPILNRANKSNLPFNKPFFVLLNFAMGGNLGGDVDPSITRKTYEIDWVRILK